MTYSWMDSIKSLTLDLFFLDFLQSNKQVRNEHYLYVIKMSGSPEETVLQFITNLSIMYCNLDN